MSWRSCSVQNGNRRRERGSLNCCVNGPERNTYPLPIRFTLEVYAGLRRKETPLPITRWRRCGRLDASERLRTRNIEGSGGEDRITEGRFGAFFPSLDPGSGAKQGYVLFDNLAAHVRYDSLQCATATNHLLLPDVCHRCRTKAEHVCLKVLLFYPAMGPSWERSVALYPALDLYMAYVTTRASAQDRINQEVS